MFRCIVLRGTYYLFFLPFCFKIFYTKRFKNIFWPFSWVTFDVVPNKHEEIIFDANYVNLQLNNVSCHRTSYIHDVARIMVYRYKYLNNLVIIEFHLSKQNIKALVS